MATPPEPESSSHANSRRKLFGPFRVGTKVDLPYRGRCPRLFNSTPSRLKAFLGKANFFLDIRLLIRGRCNDRPKTCNLLCRERREPRAGHLTHDGKFQPLPIHSQVSKGKFRTTQVKPQFISTNRSNSVRKPSGIANAQSISGVHADSEFPDLVIQRRQHRRLCFKSGSGGAMRSVPPAPSPLPLGEVR